MMRAANKDGSLPDVPLFLSPHPSFPPQLSDLSGKSDSKPGLPYSPTLWKHTHTHTHVHNHHATSSPPSIRSHKNTHTHTMTFSRMISKIITHCPLDGAVFLPIVLFRGVKTPPPTPPSPSLPFILPSWLLCSGQVWTPNWTRCTKTPPTPSSTETGFSPLSLFSEHKMFPWGFLTASHQIMKLFFCFAFIGFPQNKI